MDIPDTVPALEVPDIVPALEVPEIISYNTVEGLPLETLIVLLGQFTGCLWSGSLGHLDSRGGDGGLGTS